MFYIHGFHHLVDALQIVDPLGFGRHGGHNDAGTVLLSLEHHAVGSGAKHTKLEVALEASARNTYLGNGDRKSTRLNSSHANISYAVFCLKKKNKKKFRKE